MSTFPLLQLTFVGTYPTPRTADFVCAKKAVLVIFLGLNSFSPISLYEARISAGYKLTKLRSYLAAKNDPSPSVMSQAPKGPAASYLLVLARSQAHASSNHAMGKPSYPPISHTPSSGRRYYYSLSIAHTSPHRSHHRYLTTTFHYPVLLAQPGPTLGNSVRAYRRNTWAAYLTQPMSKKPFFSPSSCHRKHLYPNR